MDTSTECNGPPQAFNLKYLFFLYLKASEVKPKDTNVVIMKCLIKCSTSDSVKVKPWLFLCSATLCKKDHGCRPCSGLSIIIHLQMMEALRLFVLLSSQKAEPALQSCILMSSEILTEMQEGNKWINSKDLSSPRIFHKHWLYKAFECAMLSIWHNSIMQYKPRLCCKFYRVHSPHTLT